MELTMIDACRMLGIYANPNRKDTYVTCPECGKKKKLNVNFAKNVFRCPKCGVHGGVMEFWRIMNNLPDIHEAARHWHKMREGTDLTVNKAFKEKIKALEAKEIDTAAVETLNKTYTVMLDSLSLSHTHREHLRTVRGLTDEQIDRLGYKTVPSGSTASLLSKLENQGCVFEGVPGFYKTGDGRWTLNCFGGGFFIPYRNLDGQIQSLNIRQDKGNPKYIYLSSAGKLCGSGAKSFVHVAKGDNRIIITEGALKGDIISSLSGATVISVPGVNALGFLPPVLKKIRESGFHKVYIAYDMDYREKKEVSAALDKLKEVITLCKLQHEVLEWDEAYKGLDDYLLSKR